MVKAGELRTHSVVAEGTGTDWSWEDKLVSGVGACACVRHALQEELARALN